MRFDTYDTTIDKKVIFGIIGDEGDDASPTSLAVTLRKLALTEVETIAMSYDPFDQSLQDIKVIENTGALHNEWLCDRISLIPLCFTSKEIDDFDSERYEFKINIDCKSSSAGSDVTSGDIQCYVSGRRDRAMESKIFPPSDVTGDHILITKLRHSDQQGHNERLHLSCKARKGSGKLHTRWSPVCKFAFKDDAGGVVVDVESCCGLSAMDIVDKAFDALIKKLERLALDKSTKYEFVKDDDIWNVETSASEYHVIGPYIQSELLKHADVEFCGYTRPHPLVDSAIFKIRSTSHSQDFRGMLEAALTKMSEDVQTLKKIWSAGASGD